MRETVEAKKPQDFTLVRRNLPLITVMIFSFVYCFEVIVRASEKLFWYDELATVYVSRLNLHALWPALSSGIDLNPPLFYLVTRAAESLFGEGSIGTRVPEMLGFWIFCVSLFIFVGRRAGHLAGAIAMAFPMLTGAFYYAYEARPHGIVLGCCGLALVFWQLISDQPERYRWLIGFSLSLFIGFMLHCYALLLVAPFACTEIFLYRSPVRWHFWIALLGPVPIPLGMYVPLLLSYKRITQGTPFGSLFPSNWSQIQNFYSFLLSPHMLVIIAVLILLLCDRMYMLYESESGSIRKLHLGNKELSLAASFLLMPLFGVLLAKFVHAPFFSRYFLSALAGFCIVLGLGVAVGGVRNRLAVIVAALIACTIVLDVCRLAWHRYNGWPELLIEPSISLVFAGTPRNPLLGDPLLAAQKNGSLPIDILDPLYYLYYLHYAPELASRLYCALPSRDHISYRLLQRWHQHCDLKFNAPMTYSEFRKAHPNFMIYGDFGSWGELPALEGNGREMGHVAVSGPNFAVEVRVPENAATMP